MESASFVYTSPLKNNPSSKSGIPQKVRTFKRRMASGLDKGQMTFINRAIKKHNITSECVKAERGEVWVFGTEFYIDENGFNHWIPTRSNESVTGTDLRVLKNAIRGSVTMTAREIDADEREKNAAHAEEERLGHRAGAVAAAKEIKQALQAVLPQIAPAAEGAEK